MAACFALPIGASWLGIVDLPRDIAAYRSRMLSISFTPSSVTL